MEKPDENTQNYETSQYVREYSFVGLVKAYDKQTKIAVVEQRNRIDLGDAVEVFGPDGTVFSQTIESLWDEDGLAISSAPHAQQSIQIRMEKPVAENYMVRKQI